MPFGGVPATRHRPPAHEALRSFASTQCCGKPCWCTAVRKLERTPGRLEATFFPICHFVSGFGVPVSVFDSQKETTRECPRVCFFLCLNHLQWVSLLFAISLLQIFAVSFLVAVKKRKKPKKKRIAHPKGGEIQRVGSYHLVFCVIMCFLFLVIFGLLLTALR